MTRRTTLPPPLPFSAHSLPVHIHSCSVFSCKVDLSFVEPEPCVIWVVLFQKRLQRYKYKIRHEHEFLSGRRKTITTKSETKYLENIKNIAEFIKITCETYLTIPLTHPYNAFLSFWLHMCCSSLQMTTML